MRHARRSERIRSTIAVVGAFLVVVAMGTFGWLLLRPDPAPGKTLAADPVPTGDGTPTAEAIVTTPAPVVTTPPKPSPTRKILPKPTAKPPAQEKPPAPKPAPVATGTCPSHEGTDASRDTVKEALVSAAGQQYWKRAGVVRPQGLDGPIPTITVPVNLIKAFAWQESGWQSTIMACDGGIGTMQVMPGTATYVNDRFEASFDVHSLSGNTSLGAAYIEWLIMYFGLYYYSGNYSLDAVAALGPAGEPVKLLDVVVASYNVGPGNVESANNTLSIPNQNYVNNVTALMQNCECLAF